MIIRIFFTGGATGGHLFPIKAIVNELKETPLSNLKIEFYWFGPKPRFPFEFKDIQPIWLPDFQFRRYFSWKTIVDFFKIPWILLKIFVVLFWKMPNLIFVKGGSVSFFVALIAKIYNLPIIVHESDSICGLANKISSFLASKILLAFEKAKESLPAKVLNKKEVITIGQPIDESLANYSFSKEEMQKFEPERKLILILGGSQGAQEINEIIIEILPSLVEKYYVVHLTGEKLFEETKTLAQFNLRAKAPTKMHYYSVFPFLLPQELAKYYQIASLVISRAGSNTLFEIAYFGIPSIIIPLSQNVVGPHQVLNAMIYASYGACRVIQPGNLKPHILLLNIEEILTNREIWTKMKFGAKNFYLPQSAKKIAQLISETIFKEYEIVF